MRLFFLLAETKSIARNRLNVIIDTNHARDIQTAEVGAITMIEIRIMVITRALMKKTNIAAVAVNTHLHVMAIDIITSPHRGDKINSNKIKIKIN
jgi:hypothetical protein